MDIFPKNTLDLIAKLEKLGFTNAHFQLVHHWGNIKGKDSTLASHKKYLSKPGSQYQINGNNHKVAIKLKHCYEIASSMADRPNFFQICKIVNGDYQHEQSDRNAEQLDKTSASLEEKLDDVLLAEYIESFYGYGNYEGNTWFIGMEEGGGNSLPEIQSRLNTWESHQKPELADIYLFHKGIQVDDYFKPEPKIQNTWIQLIRVLLSYQGKDAGFEGCKTFQRDKLARYGSDHCLLELLPLPSPSTAFWLYGKYSNLENLRSREIYTQNYVDQRINHIKKVINKYQPKVVIFYGMSYMDYWKKLPVKICSYATTVSTGFFMPMLLQLDI